MLTVHGSHHRIDRVAEQVRRELAQLIDREVKDPAVGRVTVSGVRLSRDMAHARVLVTPAAGRPVEPILAGLRRAAGFLRHALGERVRLRIVPALHFEYDATLDTASRIEALLEEPRGAVGGAVSSDGREQD